MGEIIDNAYNGRCLSTAGRWLELCVSRGGSSPKHWSVALAVAESEEEAEIMADLLTAANSGTSTLGTYLGSLSASPMSGPTPGRTPADWWAGLTSGQQAAVTSDIVWRGANEW